ncbi:MAG: hypothetical protein FJZ57_00155 [Chlamydiae bacterium]|nr:hypothetical protein [Chlamydiota bacterium]
MSPNVNKSTTSPSPKKVGRTSKFRKMKVYKPRAKRKSTKVEPTKAIEKVLDKQHLALVKQQMADLEHRLSSDIGSFLVLLEQGNPEQIRLASIKARSDYAKISSEMQKLANELSGNFPEYVHNFLSSIDNILHTGVNWIDDAKMNDCYKATQQLEAALKIRPSKQHL